MTVTYRRSTFCCSDILRSPDLDAPDFRFFIALIISGVAYWRWCLCCGGCWKGTILTVPPAAGAAPMVRAGFPSWSSCVVAIPPAKGTGTGSPSGPMREATVATWASPERSTVVSAPSLWRSLRKTVSPSGVNMTSPKMSSRFSVAGVPLWATAAEAAEDMPGSVGANIGADMVTMNSQHFHCQLIFGFFSRSMSMTPRVLLFRVDGWELATGNAGVNCQRIQPSRWETYVLFCSFMFPVHIFRTSWREISK